MMPIFVKWLLLFLLFAFVLSIFLWYRTRKVSRFQGRLTLFFFLFVIIPLTPLTLFLGRLVIKSAETFMIPGVEESLTLSLDVFRSQLNDRGRRFLRAQPNFSDITSETLQNSDVLYVGQLLQRDGSFSIQNFFTISPEHYISRDPTDNLSASEIEQLFTLGNLITKPGLNLFESFLQTDSTVLFVGFVAPDYVVEAKNRVTASLRNYTTLSLLRETMVEEKVFWFVIFIFILFIGIISVLLARLVSSGISGPIRKLTEGMRKIGAGDLSHRVDVKAKDEVAYLIESFNRMAEELKVSRENLQRAERAAAWRDVARQVSHEIKNPLTPIEFSIYRLESSLPSQWSENADFSESLQIIKEEIAAIRRLADTFSKFAKMPHAEFKVMNVSDIVSASVDLFRNDSSGIPIHFKVAAEPPPIPLDEQQMRSVMHNLIKNAIEASERGRSISVKLESHDGAGFGIKISVTDYGCGMDEETQKRIFDPYFTTKKEGSGIGLFLAQRIIADHGGHIQVTSQIGKGSTFAIFL